MSDPVLAASCVATALDPTLVDDGEDLFDVFDVFAAEERPSEPVTREDFPPGGEGAARLLALEPSLDLYGAEQLDEMLKLVFVHPLTSQVEPMLFAFANPLAKARDLLLRVDDPEVPFFLFWVCNPVASAALQDVANNQDIAKKFKAAHRLILEMRYTPLFTRPTYLDESDTRWYAESLALPIGFFLPFLRFLGSLAPASDAAIWAWAEQWAQRILNGERVDFSADLDRAGLQEAALGGNARDVFWTLDTFLVNMAIPASASAPPVNRVNTQRRWFIALFEEMAIYLFDAERGQGQPMPDRHLNSAPDALDFLEIQAKQLQIMRAFEQAWSFAPVMPHLLERVL